MPCCEVSLFSIKHSDFSDVICIDFIYIAFEELFVQFKVISPLSAPENSYSVAAFVKFTLVGKYFIPLTEILKVALIEFCKNNGVEIISCMGTGNKLDPTKFEITDIFKTEMCPLAKVMRKELKDRRIKKSFNRANNYETECGNWLFASSSAIDGENLYIARMKNPYEIIDQEVYNTDIKPNISKQELDLFIDFYKTLPKDIDENNLPIDFRMDVYEVTSATRYPEEEC